jgi:hypothetical protein
MLPEHRATAAVQDHAHAARIRSSRDLLAGCDAATPFDIRLKNVGDAVADRPLERYMRVPVLAGR